MQQDSIYYFEKAGEHNTADLLNAVSQRLKRGDLEYVVVASSSGKTARRLIDALTGLEVKIVVVSLHAGFNEGDRLTMPEPVEQELRQKGAVVFRGSHALSGLGRSMSKKFRGITPVEIIGQTLRIFGGHGVKVAVEVAIMAADAGYIPTNRPVLAIGGTSSGADSAIVLKAAHQNTFFDIVVREIIAKPLEDQSEE